MPNSTSIATPVPCQQCVKILSSKWNLRKHEQKFTRRFLPSSSNCLRWVSRIFREFVGSPRARRAGRWMDFNSHCIYCHTYFSPRKTIKNICWRSRHCQFGMALRRILPLSQRKALSEGNRAETISKLFNMQHLKLEFLLHDKFHKQRVWINFNTMTST